LYADSFVVRIAPFISFIFFETGTEKGSIAHPEIAPFAFPVILSKVTSIDTRRSF